MSRKLKYSIISLFGLAGLGFVVEIYISYRVETGFRNFKGEQYSEARERLLLPAAIGHSFAQSTLATIYIQGLGVTRNLEQGKQWLRRASNPPFATGTYAEGLYFNGEELIAGTHGQKELLLGKRLQDEAAQLGFKR